MCDRAAFTLLIAAIFASACGESTAVTSNQTPAPPKSVLDAVTCTATMRCIAGYTYQVSNNSFETLIEENRGHGWKIFFSPNDPGGHSDRLNGVACASADWCVAVGSTFGPCRDGSCFAGPDRTLVEADTGDGWHMVASPDAPDSSDLIGGSDLNAVTCPTATRCVAVGGHSEAVGDSRTLIVAGSRNGWEIVPGANGDCSAGGCPSELTGVACATPDRCIAVGRTYSTSTLIEEEDSAGWILEPGPGPSFAGESNLSAVACPSNQRCIAVGADPAAHLTLIAETRNGRWTAVEAPGDGLASVACWSESVCVAVGPNEVLEDTGASWFVVPDPTHLAVPGCDQSSECRPNLLAVTCLVDRCVAVGFYSSVGRAGGALIEVRDKSGRWAIAR